MVKVELGTIIPKESIKQGQTKEARIWLLGSVKAEKGYDHINVWASNAEQICANECDFKVIEIIGASISNRKYKTKDGTEKWTTDYNINAKLEPYNVKLEPTEEEQQSAFEGFSKLNDEDIPF